MPETQQIKNMDLTEGHDLASLEHEHEVERTAAEMRCAIEENNGIECLTSISRKLAREVNLGNCDIDEAIRTYHNSPEAQHHHTATSSVR